MGLFAPHRVDDTVRELADHQIEPQEADADAPDAAAHSTLLAECDGKLVKHRAALEAGVDPETVGGLGRGEGSLKTRSPALCGR